MPHDHQLQELINAAALELQQHNLPFAINLYEQALEISETLLEVHEGLGQCYFLQEDYANAEKHFLRMSKLDPRDHRPLINLGAVYNRQKDYKKAIDVLRKALQKYSRSQEAFYNLGLAYRGIGQNSLALSSFREVIKMDPTQYDAYQNLANTLRDMGLLEQAQANYEKALELNPGFERAQRGLQQIRNMIANNNHTASPFGRLVDETKIRTKKERRSLRKLSEIEQAEDRQKIEELSHATEKTVKVFQKHLSHDFIPSLASLGKALLDGDLSATGIYTTVERYKKVAETLQIEFRQLRRSVLELRAHEEIMNTPELFERSDA